MRTRMPGGVGTPGRAPGANHAEGPAHDPRAQVLAHLVGEPLHLPARERLRRDVDEVLLPGLLPGLLPIGLSGSRSGDTDTAVVVSPARRVPMNLSHSGLARGLGVPPRRINEIVLGKRGVTADTALRLARYFGMSAQSWMGLQNGP